MLEVFTHSSCGGGTFLMAEVQTINSTSHSTGFTFTHPSCGGGTFLMAGVPTINSTSSNGCHSGTRDF